MVNTKKHNFYTTLELTPLEHQFLMNSVKVMSNSISQETIIGIELRRLLKTLRKDWTLYKQEIANRSLQRHKKLITYNIKGLNKNSAMYKNLKQLSEEGKAHSSQA